MRFFVAVLFLLLNFVNSKSYANDEIVSFLQQNAQELQSFDDFAAFLAPAAHKKLVLLGEASHGTSEYYTWRAEISKFLITQKGYDFIAIEADWPSAHAVNRYVKNFPGAAESAEEALKAFVRWPHWMWKNEEILEFINWLREYNDALPQEEKVGFYGVDLQNKQKSMHSVLDILQETNRSLYRRASANYNCILRFNERVDYLRMVVNTRETCAESMEEVYELVVAHLHDVAEHERFNLYHNAKLVVHAEQNLRANLSQGPDSWNVRAGHFQYTADQLLKYYGGENRIAQGAVWAHNTHIGDARATDMSRAGMVNIGQLAREAYGKENVLAIGFGTYSGQVLAGREWGAEKERMTLPQAVPGSWEHMANQAGMDVFAIDFGQAPQVLHNQQLGHRAVGVSYQPENERNNYVPTRMAQRYDVFIFFRETKGLTPLGF